MSAPDDEVVAALLGRKPQGAYQVIVRDPAGTPVVIENSPLLDDGTPMPTTFWLLSVISTTELASSNPQGVSTVQKKQWGLMPSRLHTTRTASHARPKFNRDTKDRSQAVVLVELVLASSVFTHIWHGGWPAVQIQSVTGLLPSLESLAQ